MPANANTVRPDATGASSRTEVPPSSQQ
jgi:hypothetical protein